MNTLQLDLDLLKQVLKDSLKIDAIPDTLSMTDCQEWDSLRHIALIINLEDAFQIKIEHSEIIEMTTFDSLINVISKKKRS